MDLQNVMNSLGRCIIQNERFYHDFYGLLILSHPAIGRKLAGTNVEEHVEQLRHGINIAMLYTDGKTVGKTGIKRIQETHGPLDISPDLYKTWLKCFLDLIEKQDPDMTPDLLKEWDNALSPAIKAITEEA